MKLLKKCLPDILVVLIFAVLSFAYFFPAAMDGRILFQHDSVAGRNAGQEVAEYMRRTGEVPRWTNSLFGGMPTYQMGPAYGSSDVLETVRDAYHLWLPENVWFVFAYLLGFYILLRALDFRRSLAVLGSVVWAFSSYFFIIIAAGHLWKVMALAYLPPLIAGMVLAFKGKYRWAFVVTAIFTALEINANHVQMTYYYIIPIAFMIVAALADSLRKKTMAHFGKALAVFCLGGVVGLLTNVSNLYHTWEYSKESTRGKTELVKPQTEQATSSGLDRDYITQWSYGIDETWTLLVPNAKGGSSNIRLGSQEDAMQKCNPQYSQMVGQWPQYWGDQPFTAGPVYVGAFVMMLFILGLFIVKGPVKWALLAATVLSVMLSWGKHFMPLTDFFIDYVPMYAMFRTVSSILVVAEFTIPLLAMLALKAIVDSPELLTRRIKYVYASVALTAGACLLFALAPTAFFSFTSAAEAAQLKQYVPEEYLAPMLDNIGKVRASVFVADCWRSFWIIIAGTLLLLLYKAGKVKALAMVGGIAVLCLGDMWMVNKRYLNDGMFVEKSVRDNPVQPTPAEEFIMRDKSLDYRVLNLATNTFNENETSYYLKSVGGYHAAKLRRYQEMIDAYIAPEMQSLFKAVAGAGGDMTRVDGDSIWPVLNMLNTKYFILPLQDGQTVPLQNPYAYGNAWFVDNIRYVDNATQEIQTVGKINLRHEAVADKRFAGVLGKAAGQDSTSVVTMASYDANHLVYDVQSATGGIVVFAENYYPGWTATVDGNDAEVGRVNYILRAIRVAPGSHKVELTFKPRTVDITESVAYGAYGVILLFLAYALFGEYRKRKASAKPE